jgi:RHS repeat-associated protein
LNRSLRNGPGYTGHEEDPATGLVYMQQRYYDAESGRFLSTDPVAADPNTGGSFNRYEYANDNPYRYTDPDGRFGRGTGFSTDQWNKFDAAQKSAAESLQKAVNKITAAIASGGKALKKAEVNFEKSFGKGTGTVENMTKVAATMSSMVGALKDDGSHGFMANAMTSDAMSKKYSNFGPNVLAGVPPGSKTMVVSISNQGFGDAPILSWVTGHESGHAAAGLSDQSVNGISAFKMGSPEQENAFKQLPAVDPAGAMQNPDTVMDYVH